MAKDTAHIARGACTVVNRSKLTKDTTRATQNTRSGHTAEQEQSRQEERHAQRTELVQRWTGAKWPMTAHTQKRERAHQ